MTNSEVDRSPARVRPRLGDVLIDEGLVDEAQLDAALAEQRRTGERLGRLFVAAGVITETQLTRVLARNLGLEAVNLDEPVPDVAVARLVPEPFARGHLVLPIGWDGDRLVVATANPAYVFALDDLRGLTGCPVKVVLTEDGQLQRAMDRVWRTGDQHPPPVAEEEGPPATAARPTADGPVQHFVHELFRRAVAERASDVHLEPSERELRVRFRVDGVLRDVTSVPEAIRSGVVTTIKTMCDLDGTEWRIPQDGRAILAVPAGAVELRLVTLPTTQGEALAVRIADKANGVLRADDLGFSRHTLARFRSCYRRTWGAVLIAGSTGSGRSTSLYAALSDLHDPERNIVTVEDPVELDLPAIKQVQVNPDIGLTFAAALRSIVCADPDVVLVGEISDRETATIAAEAAVAGLLVLSTVHARDAASTPALLVGMGVEPYLVTSALTGVLAQRLVRRLCDRCKQPHRPDTDELTAAGWDDLSETTVATNFHFAVGCAACARSGYQGRLAIHEVMPFTEELTHLVLAGACSEAIKARAVELGMITMRRDGLEKAAAGLTSLEELRRVVS